MTIREAIELVDRLKPNQYGSADKLRWLSELDGAVWHEIWSAHETAVPAFVGYGPEADLDGTALLIGWPYDEIYRWYLEMKIDDANGEMTKYNNSAAKYNTYYQAYQNAYGTGRTIPTRRTSPGWTMSCTSLRMERSGLSMARSGRWKTVCSGWRRRGS